MRKRPIEFLTIMTIVLMMLSSCLSLSESKSSKVVVESFMNSVMEGDVNGCIDCLSPSFQHGIDTLSIIPDLVLKSFGLEKDTKSFVSGLIESLGNHLDNMIDFKINGTEVVDNAHTKVKVDIIYNNDKAFSLMFYCTQSDNNWYIEKID